MNLMLVCDELDPKSGKLAMQRVGCRLHLVPVMGHMPSSSK